MGGKEEDSLCQEQFLSFSRRLKHNYDLPSSVIASRWTFVPAEGLIWNSTYFRSPQEQMWSLPFMATALGWAGNLCTTCKLQTL